MRLAMSLGVPFSALGMMGMLYNNMRGWKMEAAGALWYDRVIRRTQERERWTAAGGSHATITTYELTLRYIIFYSEQNDYKFMAGRQWVAACCYVGTSRCVRRKTPLFSSITHTPHGATRGAVSTTTHYEGG